MPANGKTIFPEIAARFIAAVFRPGWSTALPVFAVRGFCRFTIWFWRKKMKRFLALLLILVLALSGCGAQTPAADGAGTGSPEAGNQTPAQADGKGEIRFTETVVVDNEA